MTKRLFLGGCIASLLVLSACAAIPAPSTVADTAAATPELSTLNKLLGQAGMTDTLKGSGPYTLFAPTNEAFKEVPAKTMEALSNHPALLKSMLAYHVLPGKVAAADLKNGPTKTVEGSSVTLYRSGTFVTIEDAVVTTADVPASNGVVHIVDRVLMPPKK